MIEPNASPETAHISQLLNDYSFDVENYQLDALVTSWLSSFDPVWVNHAITEALYQGRYKIFSVHQILQLWQRRGQPIRHFNREFESIILGQSLLSSGVGYSGIAAQRSQDPAQESEVNPEIGSQAESNGAAASSQITHFGQDDELNGAQTADGQRDHLTADADAAKETDGEQPTFYPHEPSVTGGRLAFPANFRPVASGEPETSDAFHPEPIQPFVPKSDVSIMHQRLRAVVRGSHDN
jgi:hypothetical protein